MVGLFSPVIRYAVYSDDRINIQNENCVRNGKAGFHFIPDLGAVCAARALVCDRRIEVPVQYDNRAIFEAGLDHPLDVLGPVFHKGG